MQNEKEGTEKEGRRRGGKGGAKLFTTSFPPLTQHEQALGTRNAPAGNLEGHIDLPTPKVCSVAQRIQDIEASSLHRERRLDQDGRRPDNDRENAGR